MKKKWSSYLKRHYELTQIYIKGYTLSDKEGSDKTNAEWEYFCEDTEILVLARK